MHSIRNGKGTQVSSAYRLPPTDNVCIEYCNMNGPRHEQFTRDEQKFDLSWKWRIVCIREQDLSPFSCHVTRHLFNINQIFARNSKFYLLDRVANSR